MSDAVRRADHRHIDPEVGILTGEGAEQRVRDAEPVAAETAWDGEPVADPDPTYYDRPVLKEPVWKWYVPVYFWLGGAAGAAAALGAAAQAADREGLAGLVTRARWVAAAGGAAGTGLLIADLGRPSRFLNMLRVFRASSPMSVGSWVLSGFEPLAALSAVLAGADRPTLSLAGDAAGLAAGALGAPLASYTAVLLGNTAVPVWNATRRRLPALFVSSGVTAGASLLGMLNLDPREERIVRRFGIVGKLGDLVASRAVQDAASRVERVGAVLHEGVSGALWRASEALTAASLVLSLLPGRRSRGRRTVEGALGATGSLAMRFAVARAGAASARDPRATFHQQRADGGGAQPPV
jgi:formate-dependent nitrite reductase membrane component NrfD